MSPPGSAAISDGHGRIDRVTLYAPSTILGMQEAWHPTMPLVSITKIASLRS